MISELKVGVQTNQDGAQITARALKDGPIATADAHARYQEAVYRGNVFSACNQAAQALTALGTAMTGFALYNPIASSRNLVLLEADVTPDVSTTVIATSGYYAILIAAAVGPNVAAPTSTTVLTVYNNLLNPAAAHVGTALSTWTTAGVTPVFIKPIASFAALGTFGAEAYGLTSTEIAGQIIVPPGALVCVGQQPTATGALLNPIISMTWEEIPI